jgi:hypothetical protein
MAIQFLCPGGHKIQCADDRAGQPAKCPKCGVKFRVPDLAELQASGGADAQPAEPEGGQLGAGDVPPGQEGQIEFLCPNGHHLHGPRSLEGTPGECPECAVRFLVPSCDEVSDEDEPQVSGDAGQPEQEINIVTGDQPRNFQDEVPVEPGPGTAAEVQADVPHVMEISTGARADDSGSLHLAATARPLAELFAELWPQRARGAVIELHLSDGHTIVPDRFARAMSQGSFAMLSATDSDGKHTLTAVAWDSVVRVVVRGLGQLPDEFRP